VLLNFGGYIPSRSVSLNAKPERSHFFVQTSLALSRVQLKNVSTLYYTCKKEDENDPKIISSTLFHTNTSLTFA